MNAPLLKVFEEENFQEIGKDTDLEPVLINFSALKTGDKYKLF